MTNALTKEEEKRLDHYRLIGVLYLSDIERGDYIQLATRAVLFLKHRRAAIYTPSLRNYKRSEIA